MNLAAQIIEPAELPPARSTSLRGVEIDRNFLLRAISLFLLVVLLYANVVARLVQQWIDDPNYSHELFVPFCAAILLWVKRKAWLETRLAPSISGTFLIVAAMGLLVAGTLGAELFLPRFSLCLLLGGLIVYFAGWPMLRAMLAPWLILFLMIPLPAVVFNEIAFPLQLLASRIASGVLDVLQVPVLREGNIIVLPSMLLDIVEACSGLRSLMSLITIAVLYGLLFERRVWMRCLLALLAVPIAVIANAFRIVLSGLLAEYVNTRLAEGFFHAFSGLLLFWLSLAALAGIHSASIRLARSGARN